jgi:hypothetical protein
MPMALDWTPSDRITLDAILDQLIPANPDRGIPSAGAVGVAAYLSGVAARNDDFAMQVRALLTRTAPLAGDIPPTVVRQLETDMPEAFRALLTEAYKGYYSRPDIRAKVGVGAHPVHPKGYAVAPEPPELLESLTAPVRARGPNFRDPK